MALFILPQLYFSTLTSCSQQRDKENVMLIIMSAVTEVVEDVAFSQYNCVM